MTAVTLKPSLFGRQSFTQIIVGKRFYRANSEDYITRFYKLVRKWRSDTALTSSLEEIVENPSFKEIVRMGNKAVPLIISELERQPDFLFVALSLITGENPTSSQDQGDVYAMAMSWVEWSRRR